MMFLAITTAVAEDRMTVQVFNTAPQSASVLTRAEAEAAWLFRKSGIESEWINCAGLPGIAKVESCTERSDAFVVVVRADNSAGVAGEMALGFALPQIAPGNHAAILYPRVAKLASDMGEVDEAILFAHAIAHELGHLLLGNTRHGHTIMKADWHEAEFKLMAQKRFVFTREQSEAMRAGLHGRRRIDAAQIATR
jgi:hypothetical protein